MLYPKIRCPICKNNMHIRRTTSSFKIQTNVQFKEPRMSLFFVCTKCGTSLRISIRVNNNEEYARKCNQITKWWWWE